MTPVVYRWSTLALAYAVGDHIHMDVAKHSGYETCYRTSHSFIHILKVLLLFQDLGEDCVFCQKLYRRFTERPGPVL